MTHTAPYPHQFGAYELLIPIGAGATATVYLVRTPSQDCSWKYVALKRFHPHTLVDDFGIERRVAREVKLAGFLHHPNVVSLLDAGEEEGARFFVMDYVEGDTLSAMRELAEEETSTRTLRMPTPTPSAHEDKEA